MWSATRIYPRAAPPFNLCEWYCSVIWCKNSIFHGWYFDVPLWFKYNKFIWTGEHWSRKIIPLVFCANRLSLNPTKTKYIVIRNSRDKCDLSNHDIIINDIVISRIGKNCDEQSTKFLGVKIDEFLSWESHLKYINQKKSRALFALKQVKIILPVNCLRTLYFSMIHPHIS